MTILVISDKHTLLVLKHLTKDRSVPAFIHGIGYSKLSCHHLNTEIDNGKFTTSVYAKSTNNGQKLIKHQISTNSELLQLSFIASIDFFVIILSS